MKKSHKIAIGVAAVVLILIAVFMLKADDYIEAKIEKGLEDLPNNISLSYNDLEFNTLQGNLVMDSPSIEFRDPMSDSLMSTIAMDQLIVENISYMDYLSDKNYTIGLLELKNPKITFRWLNVEKDSIENSVRINEPWKNILKVHVLKIRNAQLEVNDFITDSTLFAASDAHTTFKEIYADGKSTGLLPFKYKTASANLSDIYYKLGEYEIVTLNEMSVEPDKLTLIDIKLKTKYERVVYDSQLRKERDWFDIRIDTMQLNEYEVVKRDDRMSVMVDNTTLSSPVAHIYRNKLLPDEYELKSYYSKVLRDLELNLSLNLINIEDGYISYEEKVISGHAPGMLEFSNIMATVQNFSNTYPEGDMTVFDIKTDFMETTPLNVNWTFDFNNTDDQYLFKADLGSINTQVLNQFTNRNLNVNLEGTLNQTYFTISGDNKNSNIDIKINYDDFRIVLINDERNRPKKLLNAIVNIFVRKDSDKAINDFREGNAQVSRNKYGSFYNNIWLSLQNGLKKAITSDIKKENKEENP